MCFCGMSCEGKGEKPEKRKVKKKKKRGLTIISTKPLVTNSDSSLLDTFSDELEFVTDNIFFNYIYF